MINKENLLKNRAAVQGNRSYIEQQVKTVAQTRAESFVVPNSPPRAHVSANDSKLASFNIKGLSTASSSFQSSGHGFGLKRNGSSVSSQPDAEDLRLENLRKQAAQRNFLKIGASTSKPSAPIPSSSSSSSSSSATAVAHGSNSLSSKLQSNAKRLSSESLLSTIPVRRSDALPTRKPDDAPLPVNVASQVSKNRSVLDSLYSKKTSTVASSDLKMSTSTAPEADKSHYLKPTPSAVAPSSVSVTTTSLAVVEGGATNGTSTVITPPLPAYAPPKAPTPKIVVPVAINATVTVCPSDSIKSVVPCVHEKRPEVPVISEVGIPHVTAPSSSSAASITVSSSSGSSLGGALDRFGKTIKPIAPTVTSRESYDDFDGDADVNFPTSSSSSGWTTSYRRSSYPNNETVSDNFVRRNLKQRKFSYKKDRKASKPESVAMPAGKYGSHPHDAFIGAHGKVCGADSADEGSDDEAMRVLQAGGSVSGAAGGASDVAAVGGGLSSWGLDPLALSLKAIEVQTELTAPTKTAASSASAGAASSAATKQQSRGVRMAKILANVNVNPDNAGGKKKIRGLDVDADAKPRKREKRNATVLYGVQKLSKNSGGSGAAVCVGGDEVQQLLEQYAPKCPGHQLAAKLVTVKKTGANKGKQFYACTFPREQQCKFFMWAEDNPELITATVKANKAPQTTSGPQKSATVKQAAASVPVQPALSGAEQWIVHAVQSYQVKLQSLSKSELREEVMRCNRKNALASGRKKGGAVKLNVGGSVSELIERLSAEALRVLTSQSGVEEEEEEQEQVMELSGSDSEDESDGDELVIAEEEVKEPTVKESKALPTKKKVVVASDSEESVEVSMDKSSESDVDDSSVDARRGKKRARPTASNSKAKRQSWDDDDVSDGSVVDENELNVDGIGAVDDLTRTLRRTFGFTGFREGQRWSIERSLAGRSSLLVLPTGSGKSLCYMLPSVLLPGLTIVVSPLLSLMNDQLKKLPVELPGACFSGGLTAQKAAYLCENILKGHIKILFISPERLCTPAFHRLMRLLKQQAHYKGPEAVEHVVSLLCLDEAHCLSQWSYNFRPAFLRIKREIRSIAPRAVLALTATASRAIQLDIMHHLGIDASDGLLAVPSHRKNLLLSSCVCENENTKRAAILKLVSQPIPELIAEDCSCNSFGFNRNSNNKRSRTIPLTIVYVWRRDEADALGEYLQGSNVDTVVYHAGMDADAREKSQQKFDRGTVKCVVATVAFGMGVDKSDVRQIIHHSMPKAIENYVQEVGRAGRDGKQSACRMFCSREDVTRQHSLGNSNRVTATQIVGLLLRVFRLIDPTATAVTEVPFVDRMHSTVSVPVATIESSLDISAASIETILSILELQPFHLVSVKGSYYDTVGGRFRVTDTKLKDLEQSDILVRAILKLNQIEKKVKAVSSSSRSSSAWTSGASYGLGLGNYDPGMGDSDDEQQTGYSRGAGNTYGSAITEFSCSRLEVAKECDLTPEEVSNGLYSLQRRGLLEYSLTNSALYVQITGSVSGHLSPDSLVQMSTTSGFHAWIHEVAEGVAEVLNRITKLAGDRIVNMWQVANTISAFSAVPTESSTTLAAAPTAEIGGEYSRESIQEALQQFVSFAMDQNCSVEDASKEGDALYAQVLDHYQNRVPPAFMDSSPLSAIINADKETAAAQLTSKQLDLKRKFTSDVLLLLRDPGLNEMVERIMAVSLVDVLHKQSIVSKKTVRCELMSLYVCKVLHGLSSTLLPAATWRGSPSWGRYKDLYYDDLVTAVQYLARSI